tara:strand:+ start:3346 stop:3699 length:354 start_codon:yes stop_codon:yes gene_type:complete
MKFFLICIFSFSVLVSCDSFKAKSSISFYGPILETINEEGAIEYVGRIVNKSSEKVKNVTLRYVVKDNQDNIVEAITYDINSTEGNHLSANEIVKFKFSIRSNSDDTFNKEFVLKHD